MKLITTELNEQLLDFSDSLTKYVSQILFYITFKSEERPFPFSPWPSDEKSSATANNGTQTKTSKKKATRKKVTKKKADDSEDS